MIILTSLALVSCVRLISAEEVLGCGGFVKSHVPIDFSKVIIKLYTKQGILKDEATCAPNNGYYFIPIYDKGEYNLQLESPLGWTFEPVSVPIVMDGKTDLCSLGQDINFVFKGFGIAGRVASANSDKGPAGVTVELVSARSDTPVRSTTTTTDGSFFFTLVYPGDYDIRILHSRWKLSKSVVKIHVSESDTQLPANSLLVAGYDVNGAVNSGGISMSGVHLLLYSQNQKLKDISVSDCERTNIGPASTQAAFLCYVTSDSDGQFRFPSVPTGSYVIVPQYDDVNNAKRRVYFSPESIEFSVAHDTINLSRPFQIVAFSVSGKVLQSKGGAPLANARILFNDEPVGITNADGLYSIDRAKAGTYAISVTHDEFEFETASVTLSHSPVTAVLETLYPARYRVCGTVASELAQTIAITKIGSTQHVAIASEPSTGAFCHFLGSGQYQFEILDNNRLGEHFYPRAQSVAVGLGEKAPHLSFTQLKAIVRGAVRCFANANDCNNIKAILQPVINAAQGLAENLNRDHAQDLIQYLQNGTYIFRDIRPGTYTVYLTSNRLCWNVQEQDIQVTSFEYTVPDFIQTGYSISLLSSHDTQVKQQRLDSSKPSEAILLSVVSSKPTVHCLPSPGSYIFTPQSCHGYNPISYTFKTSSQHNEIALNAVSHALTGYIRYDESDGKSDWLVIDVKSYHNQDSTSERLKLPYKQDVRGFPFTFSLAPNERRIIKPISDTLLFTPDIVTLSGLDDCVNMGEVIEARRGKLFSGHVQPALTNVEISLSSGAREWKTLTDNRGQYRFEPVPNMGQYILSAHKESYVLTGPDVHGHFHAHKLAEVLVRVQDVLGEQPLQGALVSLSGGESYRRNFQTDQHGYVTFQSLSPSEYFLRPVMKEYSFEPISQMISVAEGATVNILLTGKRVAYSAYGVATSLNNDPEENVSVIAVGIGNCSHFSEETTSEASGKFRIRGLVPWCQYDVRVRSGSLEIPSADTEQVTIKLHVQSSDIRGLRLIASKPCSITEFLISISTTIPLDHIRGNIYLKVIRPDGNVAYSAKVDLVHGQTLLYVPAVPMDHTVYTICLESFPQQCTTSAQSLDHVATVVANTSFHFVQLSLSSASNSRGNADSIPSSPNPPTSYALVALVCVLVGACAMYHPDWVQRNGAIAMDMVMAYVQPRRNDVEGKTPIAPTEIDTSDIDQIVQSINANTKRRIVKPKRI